METHLPLLSLLVWLPIIGGFVVLFIGANQRDDTVRWMALAISFLTILLTVPLYIGFDQTTADMQFLEHWVWLPSFNIHYTLGIDGIALPLILLTCFCTMLAILAGWRAITTHVHQYMGAFLIMMGLMNGVFSAMDAILFYIFWEGMLIPMFLIIGIWGGANRIYATIKFFLYTFLGSVFMLVALIYLGLKAGSFALVDLHLVSVGMTAQILIFIAFLLAFAVKIPMWPVHTWLPDAHVEAPTGGSIILAAVMLKMGAYGFLRLSLPIAPDASMLLDTMMIVLSLIAVVYIGFVALIQQDMKKLIAYSSIAHMGFVTLGLFLIYSLMNTGDINAVKLGVEGAIVQVISHGFVSAALFLGVGVMYERAHSRQIKDYGGVMNSMPIFGSFFVLFAMANAGLPGTSGFVGEFMVILAAFKANFWVALLAAMTLILGAGYTLWMVRRVVWGAATNEKVVSMPDANGREIFMMILLAILILAIGVYPALLTDMIHPTVDNLLNHVTQSKL